MDLVSFFTTQHISLIILVIFIGIYVIATGLIVYGLLRFGVGHKPKVLALTLVVVSIIALSSTIIFYTLVDWNALFQELSTYLHIV